MVLRCTRRLTIRLTAEDDSLLGQIIENAGLVSVSAAIRMLIRKEGQRQGLVRGKEKGKSK